MELCTFPSLQELLEQKHIFKESEAKLIIKSVLEALKIMHEKGVCHRDIKSENMWIIIKNIINFFF